MRELRRTWQYWLSEPLAWIFAAFFRPRHLVQKFQARLIVPLILVSYFLAFGGLIVSIVLFIVPFQRMLPDFTTVLLEALLGLTGSLSISLLFGYTFGLRESITGSVIGSLAFGFAEGVLGQPVGIIATILAVVFISIFVFSLLVSFENLRTFGLVTGFVGGIAIGLVFTFAVGLVEGLAFGLVFYIAYFLGYLRLPFYFASVPSVLLAYRTSRREPQKVFDELHRSALYWRTYAFLPLPLLKRTLLIAYGESAEKALAEITFILVERPQQMQVVRATMLEIALRDLEERINLEQIAAAADRLAALFPPETKLIDARLSALLARLSDASRDALRALSPIGLQGRRKALEDVQTNLRNVHPRTAFSEQHLNARLVRVIEIWQTVGRQEQERLIRAARDVGNVDNPYKPGQFLSLKDSLFVGRRDLAQELEGALSLESRRPTFLLNGERRMGKTSALQQLPHLLGSSYVSVFYNLQQAGLYANTATFLGVLADGIYRAMNARALVVENLAYDVLHVQQNDAYVYRFFEAWLAKVEEVLVREQRTLLLAFDEFELLEEAEQSKYMDVRLLLNWMRSIIQFHPRIALLFSGVKTFDEMGTQAGIDWTSYFINVQMVRISFLKPDEARRLITKPTADYPGEDIFPEAIVEMIIDETGGHPFLLQAVCSSLITQLNVDRREQATSEDVVQASERALEDWKGHFTNLWNRSDNEQCKCLEVLLVEYRADLSCLAQHTGLDVKVVRRAMQKLFRRDLVVRDQNEAYSIAVPMFKRWLERYA